MNSAELKGAWRAIVRAPGYAAVALLVLALGIGATTTVYAVLKGVVLNPLPYPAQHELVRIRESKLPQFPTFSVAPGKFMVWEREATSFKSMYMWTGATMNLTGRDEPARLSGSYSTAGMFETMGLKTALGRGFNDADLADEAPIVVLSHGAWMTHFGGDASVVGTAVTLSGVSHTIIGVLAPDSNTNARTEFHVLWRPGADEAQQIGAHYTGVIGRLAPGATMEAAHAELNLIAERLEEEYPDQSTGWRVLTQPLADALLGDASKRLYLLLGGVALVLLITCANVAGLTLVRTVARAHEFAIRRAQGASDGSIARQLMLEGLLLAGAGGALGAAFAAMALPVVRAYAPSGLPRIDALTFEPAVMWVCVGVSAFAGVLAAAAPALLAMRRPVAGDLRDGGRGAVGARGNRGRNALVAGEVALAVVLLAAAALLGRSVLALNAVDPGFNADTSVYTRVALPDARYDEPASARFFEQAVAQAATLPGVRNAGAVQSLPMVSDYVLTFEVDGRPPSRPGEGTNAVYYSITPGYLDAMGVPLLRGRAIDAGDRADGAPVVLVSESFAEQFFPGEEVLGQRIQISNGNDAWREIIGVVADVRQYGLDRRLEPQMYEPFAQAPFSEAFIVLESATPPDSLTGPVRDIIRELDGDQPVGALRSLAAVIADSLADRKFSAWLISAFALTALLLAAIGLYGTLAYQVSQSVREIGVRLALGAQRRSILRMVLRQGLMLGGTGALAGLVVALFGGRVLEAFVFGISARDPLTLGIIAAGMLAVAMLASALPAWRATRIDPMSALRNE